MGADPDCDRFLSGIEMDKTRNFSRSELTTGTLFKMADR
jgi:hypothetical protein